MNWTMVMGHLGGDPEERVTPGGQKVTSFNVASNTWRKGQEETVWYRITVWGDRAGPIIQHLKKGSGVVVTGELHVEIFTNRDGMPQISRNLTADNVRFMPGGRADREQVAAGAAIPDMTPAGSPANTDVDDDLPF